MRSKWSCFSALTLIILLVGVTDVCASDNADSASEAIDQAKYSLIRAHEAVLDAEKAEANIVSLTERLTEAGANLTKACLLYDVENYDAAIVLADSCSKVGEEVEERAAVLMGISSRIDVHVFFWFQIFGWIITLLTITSVSLWGWQTFKRRYYRKLLEMKPETSPQ